MTQGTETEDLWGWFDELVKAYPGAELLRLNFQVQHPAIT